MHKYKLSANTPQFEVCQYPNCIKPALNGKWCSRKHSPYGYLSDWEPPSVDKPKVKRKRRLGLKYRQNKGFMK